MSSINYSKYYIYLASGENTLKNSLTTLLENIIDNPEFRPIVEFAALGCGDILICYNKNEKNSKVFDSGISNDDSVGNDDVEEDVNSSKVIGNDIGKVVAENLGKSGESFDCVPLIIIERKRINDFCSSYKSGRLLSQRARLMSFRDCTNCACHLVVEGYYDELRKSRGGNIYGFIQSALEQAFVSTCVRDKFILSHVNNTAEHADYILMCLKTLEKYKLYEGNGHIAQQSYNESLKFKDKSNLTPKLYYVRMLSGIPMFSMDTAEKVAEVYPTLTLLLNELRTNGIENIKNLKIGKNKLGIVKAKRLIEYLL